MARGIRSNVSLLPVFSPAQQPQSLSSYDAKTRRNTILIAEIVPTLKFGSQADDPIPADRFYINFGAAVNASSIPTWLAGTVANGTFAQWDAVEKGQYLRLSNAGTASFGASNGMKLIYPLGFAGMAPSHAPKNADVTAVWIKFRARFNANADYTTTGIGGNTGSSSEFSTSANDFFQVLRNSGNWELGSSDGSTISQDSAAGGDGEWHDFWVRWAEGVDLRLYVDEELVITKTTNLPDRALFPCGNAVGVTNTIDLRDYLVEWELA